MRWRFVDKILSFQPWIFIVALKLGTLEEYYLLERWGEKTKGPVILILESALQAALWLVEASSDFTLSFWPSQISRFEAPLGLAPGEGLVWLIETSEKSERSIGFRAKVLRLKGEESLNKIFSHLKNSFSIDLFTTKDWPDSQEEFTFCGDFVPLSPLVQPQKRCALWLELGGKVDRSAKTS